MALWAIIAAPLLMSNDLRAIDPQSRQLLQNPDVIAINQDPLGKQGTRKVKVNNFEVWQRPLSNGNLALAVTNRQEIGGPRHYPLALATLVVWRSCYTHCNVTQVLPRYRELGVQSLFSKLELLVNPTGTVLLVICPVKSTVCARQQSKKWLRYLNKSRVQRTAL